jgi:HEAT repeat protein
MAHAEDRSSEVPGLLITLKSDKPAERAASARILGEIGPQARDAVGGLAEALKDPDRDVRQNAAYALGYIGKASAPAVPALVTALHDREWQVRRAAATALGHTGSKDAEKPLKDAKNDKVESVRAAAKQGLKDLKKK